MKASPVSPENRLRKIERASVLLRGISTALFIPLIVVTAASTVSTLAGWTAHIEFLGRTFVPSELGIPSRLVLAAVVIVSGAVIGKCLRHLRRLACNYADRRIFTADSARQLRQFGVGCVLWGLVKIVWAFLPLVVSSPRPPLYYATSDSILLGVVFIGISWFAEMAAEMREENDLTI